MFRTCNKRYISSHYPIPTVLSTTYIGKSTFQNIFASSSLVPWIYTRDPATGHLDAGFLSLQARAELVSELQVLLQSSWLVRNNLLTYGAEPYLRSCQLSSPSRTPSILWNPKIQYRVHKSPPLVPILSHINPIHSSPFYISKKHFDIVHPPTSWSSQWSLSFWLTQQYPTCNPLLPIRATCPAYLILRENYLNE
jgi:hypothetical protein